MVFLKYFKEVYIESIFEKQIRKFTFKKNFEKNNFTLSPAPDATYMGSRLAFSGYLYGQTNEKYKENSRKSSAAYRKPITYSRASNFGSKNEM